MDLPAVPPLRRRRMDFPKRIISVLAVVFLFGGVQARQAWEEAHLQKSRDKPIAASEFARIFTTFSEEGGSFRSDNFVSNETSYLHVVDRLKQLGAAGGAYIGVGPEQNFTYIAKIRPRIAFIVDIRRQAVIQHLMYKAIFHLAPTRTRFLAMLLSRPVAGSEPGPDAAAGELVNYFYRVPASYPAYAKNLATIADTIERDFRIPLAGQDRSMLEYVYSAFRDENLDVQYRSGGFLPYGNRSMYPWSYFPTLADLILETDLHNRYGNFLASRADYEFVRSLQESNRIIPVVGDFGGSKALSAIAGYLKRNGYTVSAFYTSNVEQYLFTPGGGFDAFAANVGKLPITERSLFIRAYPNQRIPHPAQIGNHRLTTLLQKIQVFLDDYKRGLYTDYWTLVRTHYIGAMNP